MNINVDVSTRFRQRLDQVALDIENLLDRLLEPAPLPGEPARPQRLLEAMRYVSLGGGKRLRPFLVVESAALLDVPRERALMAGAALECIHCYSLVHDDLPAMDDDDLRRGRPTAHKAFDEATAILAGDALLTFAFDILAGRRPIRMPRSGPTWCWRWRERRVLAAWSAARCSTSRPRAASTAASVRSWARRMCGRLQAMKTGALLRFGCLAGAILGEASPAQREALERYGAALGEAFQIADDLLDIEGDAGDGRQGDRQGRRRPQGDAGFGPWHGQGAGPAEGAGRELHVGVGALWSGCRHAQGGGCFRCRAPLLTMPLRAGHATRLVPLRPVPYR